MSNFNYAFKVKDIATTRTFYVDILGCKEGRTTENWNDFDFFGNQLSAHISNTFPELDYCGNVDGKSVPVPHFGCLVSVNEFKTIQQQLINYNVSFVISPYLRYEGKTGEHLTMFVLDYSNNPLEFKAFTNNDEVFKL